MLSNPPTRQLTAEVPDLAKQPGETIPRRNARFLSQLASVPSADVQTAYDILRRSSIKYGEANAIAKRQLLRMHQEDEWSFYELSGYEYSTFNDFQQVALKAGYAFRALGLRPKKDRIHMYGTTHPNWLATAHGAMSQSLALVTAYDSLGEEALTHALQQTNAKAMFLDSCLLSNLSKPFQVAKDVQYLVYNNDPSLLASGIDANQVRANVQMLKDNFPQIKAIYSWTEFIELGDANSHVGPSPPSAQDLACVMYTSGSTAMPKGVMISHKNLVASITGLDSIFGQHIGRGDRLLAYLPLAHMLEFAFETACLYWGATMGYGTSKTLFDQSVRYCRGDILEFRPTVLVGVPAIWEAVKKSIIRKVATLDAETQSTFWKAQDFDVRPCMSLDAAENPLSKSIFESMGGKLKLCITGGGPIAPGTQRFIARAIAPLVSGYGLTETSAMGAIMDPASWTDKALGEIPASVEVKLVDYADYSTAQKPPQGEIWIRGDSVASGYLCSEDESRQAFSSDGWFKTGDVGEFDDLGQLKIIDRKKNLVKAPSGEYIALEKLESIYRSSGVVSNLCVSLRPGRSRPMAIVVPNGAAFRHLAPAQSISTNGTSSSQLSSSQAMAELMLGELHATGRREGLASFELVEAVVLTEEEWTPQSKLLTSVGKLNRKALQEKFETEIDHLYDNLLPQNQRTAAH